MGKKSMKADGVKVTPEEAGELEEKAQETWHWKEVDLRDWCRERLNALFKHRVLVDTDTEMVHLWKTECYGEAFATSRKGHTEVTCNLDCRIFWRGQLRFNGGVVGTADGTIKFPEVIASSPVEEWPMKILADGEDPSAMKLLNPCGSLEETQLRELEPYEVDLRNVATRFATELRGLMAKFVQDMRAFSAGEEVGEVCTDKADQVDDEISEKVRQEVHDRMEKIRADGVPAKVSETLEKIEANDESLERVELSVCRISDTEITTLVNALKNNTNVKQLNLSFNQITDVGVQALVTAMAGGAAKGLEELLIHNNQIGNMGVRMLEGLKFMRKNLKVITESSITNISPAKAS